MIKIAHAADIHIRSFKYLDEMKFTFDEFYKKIDESEPDLIFLGGDIFHSKLTVSNEYFALAYDFFKELSSRATLLIIPGNHDLALNNKSRMDAITPVVKALRNTKNPVIYSKMSETIIPIKGKEKYQFHHFSILQNKREWPKKDSLDETKVNFALYHGSINGSAVDNGWISRGNKDNLSIFDGFDFGLLGDIHLQQFLTPDKRVGYPGSLRQNNYGETVDKGFLLWEIEDGKNFEVERVLLEQKRYFFTLYGSEVDDVKDIGDLPEDCRIRFKLTEPVDFSEELRIKSEIERLYLPQNEVNIIQLEERTNLGSIQVGDVDVLHENIRQPQVQKELIKEFFKDKNLKPKDLEDVSELDKKYHSYIDTDVERDVTYDIDTMKFGGLFAYGPDNFIDFTKTKGLTGFFGENAIGKSSLPDILTLGLQNTIHKKGANRNIEYINNFSEKGFVDINLKMNGKKYGIDRELIRKKTKSGETCLANIDFYERVKRGKNSLNGEKKPDTNKKIRDRFGTDEDFENTSLCPQFELTKFIDARATKRKEILAKYFDLGLYGIKYSLAKNDFDELKGRLEEYNYTKIELEIEEKKIEVESLESLIKKEMGEEKNQEALIEEEEEKLKSLYKLLRNTDYTQADLDRVMIEASELSSSIEELKKNIEESEIEDFSNMEFSLEKTKSIFEEDKKHLQKLERDLFAAQKKKESCQKSSLLLKEIPNVPQCQVCTLAHDAFESDSQIPKLLSDIELIVEELKTTKQSIEMLDYENVIERWEKSNLNSIRLASYKEVLETKESSLKTVSLEVDVIKSNLEDILANEEILKQTKLKEEFVKEAKAKRVGLSENRIQLISKKAIAGSKIEDLTKRLETCEELNRQKFIFELYLKAMGKNGISYWIISKKMPILNKQVNFILSQAVNFKLFIEDNEEEKTVKIYIVDEKGKRSIELGSGMEKTVSSLALRAALWNICLLPKTPLLILDEAFAHLDQEKYDSVIKLLVYMKNYFESIWIITHDEGLKGMMDHSYYIKKDSKGFASCQIK